MLDAIAATCGGNFPNAESRIPHTISQRMAKKQVKSSVAVVEDMGDGCCWLLLLGLRLACDLGMAYYLRPTVLNIIT